ncbi:hypothetical protein [Streptomyces sp. NBC_01750]|uniref:hypothetical protein n=1 Tax=Streptomyces sp. NBC_01750 TaxID=2975928 RepID=UPI002DD88608|nr:hypothetical protein [Streptomyces sp. NBC_01750]WSD38165.1 hypothetical protein OG966_40445 [Streptomyces sp. NBC_01750]
MITLPQASAAWIRRATPAERRTYMQTGSRGPGMPVDLRPASTRMAEVHKVLNTR